MKKYIIILLLILGSISKIIAQGSIQVTGTVTDKTNTPLEGVSVSVKDRVGGTTTDSKGQYKIMAEPYSTLIFSYVGMQNQEIKIGTKGLVNIVLKSLDSNVLDQVVVTAAGPQKKATVVGAITTVDVSTLRTPTANITNALAGNVPGVIAMQTSGEPGNNKSEFWIRGISTFGANQAALVLVDGFERPFNEINIEDIQNFSILKDASATALYGSKGANGVILITTKKGRAGKINIDGKVEYGNSTRTRTPKYVDGYTYAQLVNEAKTTRNQEPLYTPTELEIFKYDLDPDLYPNVNWQDKMLRNSANSERATINLSGGATIARYFVSASYVNEGGMYKSDATLKDYRTNANLSRWNYRINYDLDISKTTTLSLGIAGFLEKQNFPGLNGNNIWYSLMGTTPVAIPLLYSNGLVPTYGTGNQTNPWVMSTQTGYIEKWRNKFESNVTLNQRLDMVTPGLRATGRLAFDTDNGSEIDRVKWPEQYQAERRRDKYGNLIMHRISPEQLMTQTSVSSGERVYQVELQLDYSRKFGGKHTVEGLAKMFERELRNTQNVGGDIKNGIPHRNLSYSGRAMYGFMNKYFAEFNFGYTGSENFAQGHQWGFFPALAVGWNLSEEKFIKNKINWLDLLKIRYSIGDVGNDNFGDLRFAYLSTLTQGGGYAFGESIAPQFYQGLYYSQVASNNLTWEVARKQNLGLDVNVMHNMFTFIFDIFKEHRSNIYMQRAQLPAIIGVTSQPWANVGEMENKGFDGNFGFNKKIRNVNLTVRGNLTYYRNKILAKDEQENVYPYKSQVGFRNEQTRGLIALGLFKDYEDIRNSPTQYGNTNLMPGDIKYKDVNGDGVINDDDIVPIGSSWRPAMEYGMGASLSWKGFDINILFQGAGKCDYFINGPTVYPFSSFGWGNILTDVAKPGNRWISKDISGDPATENPNAKYPRLSYGGNSNNYRESTYWLRNGSYLRFKTLEMGYTIPGRFAKKAFLNSARLYLLANNLCVWDKLKIWDPEVADRDGTKYPPSRTITLGVNFKF